MRAVLAFCVLAVSLEPQRAAALDGDTFVPVHEEARRDLARGDRALEAARSGGSEKAWTDTFDSWQAALEKTVPGDLVPLLVQEEGDEVWPDPDGNFARRTEDVALSVLGRIARLEEAERAQWRTRFSPLAEERLLEARSGTALLASLERRVPATRSASLAALRLADRALEAGRPQTALAWLERGKVHAELAGELESLSASFAARERFLAEQLLEPEAEAWKNASSLVLQEEVDLRARSIGVPPKGEGFDRGLISGGVFLDDGRFVIHHPLAVFVVAEDGAGPIFEPRKLLEAFPRQSGATFAPSGQAWPLEPATDGTDLFFVLGRAIVAGNTSAVCRLSPPPAIGEAARLGWVLSTHGHANSENEVTPIEELLEPGTWEFQPGPAVFESLLIVQARQWLPIESGAATAVDTSRPRCWTLALDMETGFPVWTRFLGKGSDVQQDFGARFGGGRPAAPAQPVAISGSRAFCATGVGLGASLNLVDGRINWTFLPSRRDEEESGWVRAHRPGFVNSEGVENILWGPPDSAELYWLRAKLEPGSASLESYPPAPIRNSVAVLAGESRNAILLGFAGPARSLAELNPETGALTQGLRLRRTEEFRGPSLASESRVFLCTDRTLYLFDRENELRLMESHGLRGGNSEGGGTLVATEGRIAVLGKNRVFLFEVQ